MTHTATFGALLCACRRSAGLSQEELAKRSGLSVRAIGDIERARTRVPHPGTVRRLAEALGVSGEERGEFYAAASRRLGGSGQIVPRQLPGPVRQFTGRRGELAALTSLLRAGGGELAALVISAIAGTAGVGKTALAVHWAHQVSGQFPDGQLYADLRGFDPSGRPAVAGEVLAGFLRALGLAPQDIPAGVAERAAAYRSLLAGRRVLVLLDNAGSAGQVRPLLPGSAGCVTLVTSRDALAGLTARDGAVRLELDLLPLPEAVALLRGLIGSRAEEDPDAAGQLAILCGRLPLALRVAAELAITRPAVPLADLADELAGHRHRLEALDAGGDERTTVQAVFAWSYRSLSPEAARMFRLAGIHPAPELSLLAAASLARLPTARARRALSDLARAHLLAEHAPGRFSCHDLLRIYAAGLAAEHDSPAQRRAAIGRVLDYYLHTAHAADRLLHPSRDPIVLTAPRPGATAEQLAGPEQAMAWFEAEHQSLLATIRHAAESGSTRHAWQLSWSMATFLTVRAHWDDLTATQRTALAAATSLDDHAAQALAHDRLGFSCLLRGHHDQAAGHFDRALNLFEQAGDQAGQACTHLNVSFLLEQQGRHAEAVAHDERALRLFQATEHQAGQARALNAAGWHLGQHGDHHQALARCQQALALQRRLGDRLDEAGTWDSIGYIHHQLGQHAQAARCYQQALRLLAQTKERHRTAIILDHLGDTRHATGDVQAARDAWTKALAIFHDIQHHPDAQAIRAKLAPGTEHPRPGKAHGGIGSDAQAPEDVCASADHPIRRG
jgi:tetratricopeptide (TPR) repeat protein/transcriptional regulator with XRE-family HTH domain